MPSLSRSQCQALDDSDPLAYHRSEFALAPGLLYFDGNSLGPRPHAATAAAIDVVDNQWGKGLIGSWNDAGWFDLPQRLGRKIGMLIGAGDGETVVTDTTSINLFKALSAAIQIQRKRDPRRTVLVTERDNFPSDIYIAQGLAAFLDQGYEVRLIDEQLPLASALGDDVALVSLSHVNYRTGAMYDMAQTTEQIHNAGALAIWDLAHAAGAVPVDLRAGDADFAVGCTYKYLNGGPGSPAFIWVAKRHQNTFWQPLTGWWSHTSPFDMADSYTPAHGISRYLCGTQPITSMALIEPGLDISLSAPMDHVRAKSIALAELFISLVEEHCPGLDLTLITPRSAEERGSHVSYFHPHGYAVMQALIARGIVGDYREPGVLRFGLTPLYMRYVDVFDAVAALREILLSRAWDQPQFLKRNAVT